MRAFVGLGSNLGERWRHLETGVAGLAELDPGLAVSPVYETAPVGGPAGQGAYLNCVVGLDAGSPEELLATGQRLESEARRVRAERNGPRTLDVDVLLVEGVTSADPRLTLPHPRMYERAFVLAPLADLEPSLVPTDWVAACGGPAAVAAAVRRVGELVGWRPRGSGSVPG